MFTARYGLGPYNSGKFVVLRVFSPRSPEFGPRSVHVKFLADSVALRQVFLPEFEFSLISINPPYPIRIFTYMLRLPEGQITDSWEPPNQQCSIGNLVAMNRTALSLGLHKVNVPAWGLALWCS